MKLHEYLVKRGKCVHCGKKALATIYQCQKCLDTDNYDVLVIDLLETEIEEKF